MRGYVYGCTGSDETGDREEEKEEQEVMVVVEENLQTIKTIER